MEKLNLMILFGGKSGEHEVSITSAMSIYRALDKTKYNITFIGIDKTGRWVKPSLDQLLEKSKNPRSIKLDEIRDTFDFRPYCQGSSNEFDVIFPVLHGTNGEDGTLQGLLELRNIAYVGSGVLGSALCMDKDVSKRILRDARVPIVPFQVIRRSEIQGKMESVIAQAKKQFGYPFFVKPANTGSSVGVNKVKNDNEALRKFQDAFLYDDKILVEKGIDARELECAVLGNDNPKASVLGEIIPRHEFYSYEAKYIDADGADLHVPAKNLDEKISDRIRKFAVDAFIALECAGMARVDFFVDRRSGEIYLNELNTIPGFTSISMYPKMWEASGLSYPKLLDELIELALQKHAARGRLKTTYTSST